MREKNFTTNNTNQHEQEEEEKNIEVKVRVVCVVRGRKISSARWFN
jgi:hypothetical protein